MAQDQTSCERLDENLSKNESDFFGRIERLKRCNSSLRQLSLNDSQEPTLNSKPSMDLSIKVTRAPKQCGRPQTQLRTQSQKKVLEQMDTEKHSSHLKLK